MKPILALSRLRQGRGNHKGRTEVKFMEMQWYIGKRFAKFEMEDLEMVACSIELNVYYYHCITERCYYLFGGEKKYYIFKPPPPLLLLPKPPLPCLLFPSSSFPFFPPLVASLYLLSWPGVSTGSPLPFIVILEAPQDQT